MRFFIVLTFSIFLAGCSFTAEKSVIEKNNGIENTAQETCKENGGKYEKGGKLQQYFCNKKSETAGKNCSSSGECDGFCLDTREGGKCSEYETNFGCTDILEEGEKTTICVD